VPALWNTAFVILVHKCFVTVLSFNAVIMILLSFRFMWLYGDASRMYKVTQYLRFFFLCFVDFVS